jgi:hypothetical protein
MKRRTKRRRTGNSRLAVLACAAALWLWPAAVPARGGDQTALKTYALIAGTVFQESGLSLRGAEIQLVPDPQDAKSLKLKKLQGISDSRGEFAFRVPAQPARYIVKVRRRGFTPQEKPVAVRGDERIDLVFRLEPVP